MRTIESPVDLSSNRETFQSPFHRGNGCYLEINDNSCEFIKLPTFSPFSSGQWLLLAKAIPSEALSPLFIVGNGCYWYRAQYPITYSFSPLFIAAMVATLITPALFICRISLSVPFSSGQWLLANRDESCSLICHLWELYLSVRFSSGQWLLRYLSVRTSSSLSVPFSSGQSQKGYGVFSDGDRANNFQSAFHRGNGCYQSFMQHQTLETFSPLFIGAMVATNNAYLSVRFSSRQWLLLHAFIVVSGQTHGFILHFATGHNFQSAFHRGNGCYEVMRLRAIRYTHSLSVPFSSGQWLLLSSQFLRSSIATWSFSPLFIGAMVATRRCGDRECRDWS